MLERLPLKILFSLFLMIFIFCSRQKTKTDVYEQLWSVKFLQKYVEDRSEVILYKIQDDKFSQNDSLKINQWEIIKAHSLFLPDSIKLDIFKIKNPFSPVTNFKFYIEKSDSVFFTFFSNEDMNTKVNLYQGYLNRGYYLLKISRIDVDSGVYQVSCKIGKERKKKKIILIK